MTSEEQYTGWCKQLMSTVTTGGIWGVPRSGLCFKKVSETELALNDVCSATNSGIQTDDFACIQRHFKAAGIAVSDPNSLLKYGG